LTLRKNSTPAATGALRRRPKALVEMPGQGSAPAGRNRCPSGRFARPRPFDRPLDHALERLRAHRLPYSGDAARLHVWRAVCPCCRVPDWTLTLSERGYGGALDLRCAADCTDSEIRAALERDPAEVRIEAAEVREAQAWEIAEELRALLIRALRLAGDALRQLARTDLPRITA
jgi:hypothetical protein